MTALWGITIYSIGGPFSKREFQGMPQKRLAYGAAGRTFRKGWTLLCIRLNIGHHRKTLLLKPGMRRSSLENSHCLRPR